MWIWNCGGPSPISGASPSSEAWAAHASSFSRAQPSTDAAPKAQPGGASLPGVFEARQIAKLGQERDRPDHIDTAHWAIYSTCRTLESTRLKA